MDTAKMNSMPLVSVVTIFLNAEKFIQESIESVFAQTYTNWELLLVDDGSTDRSSEIALRYAERYPGKIRYLEHDGHQNRGMSASRNMGIHNAKGEYLALLDADDIWLPPKLERQVAILNSQPDAAMVYGPTQYWYGWSGDPQDIQRDFVPSLGVQSNTLVRPPTLLTLFFRGAATVPCICSLLVVREVIEALGGFEEDFRDQYEDQVFYAKICLNVPVYVAGDCWDRYRQHPDSSCSVAMKTGKNYRARLRYLKWLARYMRERELEDTEVWKALQKQLGSYRYQRCPCLVQRQSPLMTPLKRALELRRWRTYLASGYRWFRTQWYKL
jgi:glycosyltransferase involved in cell wall biosynthesis